MPYRRHAKQPHDSRLTLKTLGAAALWRGIAPGEQTLLLEAGKPLALLVYLAVQPTREVHRGHLLDLLWSDLEPDGARHALRQTLYHIRRLLGDDILTATADAVRLSPAIAIDAQMLVEAAAAGDHARVVELWQGDFFAAFAAPGGAEFERWADLERGRFRGLFIRAADVRLHELLTAGRTRDAVSLARRVRDLDRSQQAGWRTLISTLIAVRDSTGALLEADALDTQLEHDECEPEPPTRALLRVVRDAPRSADAQAPSTRSLVAELVGREREFSALLAAWNEARASRGRHVHLRGAAGLGKTRLLDDFRARLRSGRARVVGVRCNAGARDVPYAAAADMAAALSALSGARGISPASAGALVALNPTLSSAYSAPTDASPHADRDRRYSAALGELLAAVAEEHPVAVLLDDLHWCDPPSRALLSQLANRLSAARALLVTTGRPQDDARLDNPTVQEIDLSPLDLPQVGELISSIAALPDEPWTATFARDLWQASQGSPLLALETLQLLESSGMLVRDEHRWSATDPVELLARLRSGGALRRRIELLPATERSTLLLLSAAGAPLAARDVADMLQLAESETMQQLRAMEINGFVQQGADWWRVAHDEIAGTALQFATAQERCVAHRAIGTQLWRRNPDDDRILPRAAMHLALAGDRALVDASFHRFVRRRRALGDSRRLQLLAGEFAGNAATPDGSRRLVRSLPPPVRLGLTSSRRIWAAVLAGVLLPLSLALTAIALRSPAPVQPDAELVVIEEAPNGVRRGWTVPLAASEWSAGRDIDGGNGRSTVISSEQTSSWQVELPGRRGTWIFSRLVADTGVQDLFLFDGSNAQRLTSAPGDDVMQDVSPDGGHVLFSTARWSTDSHYDLAILDLDDLQVRVLTHGNESDAEARWSHDGSRIAFKRHDWRDESHRLCVVAVDGSGLRCLASPTRVDRVLGWFDEARVAVTTGVGPTRTVLLVGVDDQSTMRLLRDFSVDDVSLSPDGAWLACTCGRLGYAPRTRFVVPVGRDEAARPVVLRSPEARLHLAWRAPRKSRAIERLVLEPSSGQPMVGVPHQLRALAYPAEGAALPTPALRWTSSDRTILEIDERTGVALPRRAGAVHVRAEVPGWVFVEDSMRVAAPASAVIFTETWRSPLTPRWRLFGDPQPAIDSSTDRPRFLNNGDGSLWSGAHTAQAFAVASGLALETELAVKITRPQWQVAYVSLAAIDELKNLPAENVAIGRMLSRSFCSASYPRSREGLTGADSVEAEGQEGDQWEAPAPPGARSGQAVRVRLQLLPDGRCAVAVNGRPVFFSRQAVRPADSVQVYLSGSSVGTKALVGPITVWRGVPPGVDWMGGDFGSRAGPAARRR